MGQLLLRSTLVLVLMIAAAPAAHAQYIFTDTDLDGACTFSDGVAVGLDTVWVWIDTNHDSHGNVVTCATGEALTIADYELCLVVESYATGYWPLTVGRWINKVPEFTDSLAFQVEMAGYAKVHVYWSSSGASTHLPPGKYLLGGLEVTMQKEGACNQVMAVSTLQMAGTTFETGFYSDCPGYRGDNRIRLGDDFADSCRGGGICSPVESTTWGHIKATYR